VALGDRAAVLDGVRVPLEVALGEESKTEGEGLLEGVPSIP